MINSQNIYTRIGPFCIQIILKDTQSSVSQDILLRIFSYLDRFIIKEPSSKPDFTIEITEDQRSKTNFITLQKDKQIEIYIKNFIVTSKQKIITYNGISTYAFDFILKRVISELLYRNNLFFVHASACLYNNKSYLFFGKNCAGKSTIVTLLSEVAQPLADDYGIVAREQNDYYFYQTPFICKNRIKGNNKKHKIHRLFFLRKANKFAIKPTTYYEDERNILKLFDQIINKYNNKEIINFFHHFHSNHYILSFSLDKKVLITNAHKLFG